MQSTWVIIFGYTSLQVKSSKFYCQFFHMYSTYIQRIEIALLSDPWCMQLTLSEFSVAWGKRGEGGQGREGVQLPDSLMDKAVLQSAGPRLETPQSPP